MEGPYSKSTVGILEQRPWKVNLLLQNMSYSCAQKQIPNYTICLPFQIMRIKKAMS